MKKKKNKASEYPLDPLSQLQYSLFILEGKKATMKEKDRLWSSYYEYFDKAIIPLIQNPPPHLNLKVNPWLIESWNYYFKDDRPYNPFKPIPPSFQQLSRHGTSKSQRKKKPGDTFEVVAVKGEPAIYIGGFQQTHPSEWIDQLPHSEWYRLVNALCHRLDLIIAEITHQILASLPATTPPRYFKKTRILDIKTPDPSKIFKNE